MRGRGGESERIFFFLKKKRGFIATTTYLQYAAARFKKSSNSVDSRMVTNDLVILIFCFVITAPDHMNGVDGGGGVGHGILFSLILSVTNIFVSILTFKIAPCLGFILSSPTKKTRVGGGGGGGGGYVRIIFNNQLMTHTPCSSLTPSLWLPVRYLLSN